jgi:IPT/TIG domain
MRISLLSIPLLLVLAPPANPQLQTGIPLMSSVQPASGKVGDVLSIQGTNLGRDFVAALYLTDGKTDCKVPMIAQTSTSIKFKIPPEAKPGRFALMVLTIGKNPNLIEEPVKIVVEPGDASATSPQPQ